MFTSLSGLWETCAGWLRPRTLARPWSTHWPTPSNWWGRRTEWFWCSPMDARTLAVTMSPSTSCAVKISGWVTSSEWMDDEHIWTRTDNTRTAVARRQVGGLGVKDYSGRQPNQEQLENVVCKSDPKPGFSFILDNFAELLDDTFLQNLTSTICQGKHTRTATQTQIHSLPCSCLQKNDWAENNWLLLSHADKRCPDYKCPSKSSSLWNALQLLLLLTARERVSALAHVLICLRSNPTEVKPETNYKSNLFSFTTQTENMPVSAALNLLCSFPL